MDTFDCVFVLNLEQRQDRMERVTDILHYLQIPFERFNAIDSEVIAGLHKNLFYRNNETTITRPGYLACVLSHLSIYKTALDRGYKNALILEDDILVHKDAKEHINTFMRNVPANWDMIYFGYLPLSEDLSYWSHDYFSILEGNNNVFRAKGLWCTHAYAINEKFMKDTIDLYNKSPIEEWLEIDRYFVKQQDMNFNTGGNNGNNKKNIYGCIPSLFGQYGTNSDLTPGFFTEENEKKFINAKFSCRQDFL